MLTPARIDLIKEHVKTIPSVIVEHSIARDIDDIVLSKFGAANFCVVDDTNTGETLGNRVAKALLGGNIQQHITLPGHAYADDAALKTVEAASAKADVIIAVGSGTINDLCKLASYRAGKPYAVFATAASMNGYLSANASITHGGYKQSVSAHLPALVVCDVGVISQAPKRLSISGYGDAMARSTSQTDWLLSHILLGTDYTPAPYILTQENEAILHEYAGGIGRADPTSITLLLENLLLSGLGMTVAGGSYPASQGEHMIAHTHEMMAALTSTIAPQYTLHGEEIAVTSLHMAKLQVQLLQDMPTNCGHAFDARATEDALGLTVAIASKAAYERKEALIRTAELRASSYEKAQEACMQVCMPPDRMLKLLELAGAPTRPEALGWSAESFAQAARIARYTRDRFTFLDLE
jgi:glycerol-1-phosphate dehydrogenase [NAD(P)+]